MAILHETGVFDPATGTVIRTCLDGDSAAPRRPSDATLRMWAKEDLLYLGLNALVGFPADIIALVYATVWCTFVFFGTAFGTAPFTGNLANRIGKGLSAWAPRTVCSADLVYTTFIDRLPRAFALPFLTSGPAVMRDADGEFVGYRVDDICPTCTCVGTLIADVGTGRIYRPAEGTELFVWIDPDGNGHWHRVVTTPSGPARCPKCVVGHETRLPPAALSARSTSGAPPRS